MAACGHRSARWPAPASLRTPQPSSGGNASTPFWSITADRLLSALGTDPQRGPNRLVERQRHDVPVLLSFALGDATDGGGIILVIVLVVRTRRPLLRSPPLGAPTGRTALIGSFPAC